MGEADYNRLLDAVDAVMKSAPEDDAFGEANLMRMPVPANDNDGCWPHLPFPDGWIASN